MYLVAVTNQKGGVGKTATALNLAAALAEMRKKVLQITTSIALPETQMKVLLVDIDPAGHSTQGLEWSATQERDARISRGLPVTKDIQVLAEQEAKSGETQTLYKVDGLPTLFQALIPEAAPGASKRKSRPTITPDQLIRVLPGEYFDLLPSHEELVSLQQWLPTVPNTERRLAIFLEEVKGYDVIVLDGPPDLGPITDSILHAARSPQGALVVPVEADTESVNALDQLFAQIESLELALHIQIDILTIVTNKYEDSRFGAQVLKDLRAALPVVAPFEIRKRNVMRDAYAHGRTSFTFWPSERAERHKQKDILALRGWYTQLADLVEKHFAAKEGEASHGR